jgi:protein SCO1/2
VRAILLALLLLAAAARAQEPKIDPTRDIGIDQEVGLGKPLPLDARFVDEEGRPVRLGDLIGERPVILALVYYECPMLCTLVLNGLVSCLKVVDFDAGTDFDVVVISIDPTETPELAQRKKKSYVAAYGRPATAAGWHFLCGEQAEIARVAKAAGFRYVYDEDRDEYAHAAGIMVATPEGRLSRYFFGIEFPPRDLRLGLVEASDGRIGSVVDSVLLFCFHYDPTTGRYGFVIQNVIRLLGGLTLLVLAVFVVRSLRRERHAEPKPAAHGAP